MNDREDQNESNSVGSPHDTMFYKFITLPEVYLPFFQRHLPSSLKNGLDWDSLEPSGERFVSNKLRNLYSDCLFSAKHPSFKEKVLFFVLLEHKHKIEKLTPFQLLCYMVEIWRLFLKRNPKAKKLPYIHPMVFYTGKATRIKSLNIKDLIEGPVALVASLFNEPIQLVTAREMGREGEAAMLNLMSLVFLKDVEHYYRELLRKLKAQPPQSQEALLEAILTYIIETDPEMTEETFVAITQEELLGKESTMVMTLADRIRNSGKKKWQEQGILIGEHRGELRGELESLRKLLQEGILTREQYHAKAEPLQAKLDALLAEGEAKTKES